MSFSPHTPLAFTPSLYLKRIFSRHRDLFFLLLCEMKTFSFFFIRYQWSDIVLSPLLHLVLVRLWKALSTSYSSKNFTDKYGIIHPIFVTMFKVELCSILTPFEQSFTQPVVLYVSQYLSEYTLCHSVDLYSLFLYAGCHICLLLLKLSVLYCIVWYLQLNSPILTGVNSPIFYW